MQVRAHYRTVPYHNFFHCVDVTHATFRCPAISSARFQCVCMTKRGNTFPC